MSDGLGVGSRPHRIQLQNPSVALPDGDGGFTYTWFDLNPPQVWAAIEPATANALERLAAGTVIATASHIVTLPYHPQVTTKTRVVFQGRVLAVVGVQTPEERRLLSILICVEQLGAPLINDLAWTQPGWIGAAVVDGAAINPAWQSPDWHQEGTL